MIISGALALIAAALVFGIWYPDPFRSVSGGGDLFLLLVLVDVALGPLATVAIFDRRKSRSYLRRDLAVVALLQLGAFGYGLHTVWVSRPWYLVYEVDRFVVVRALDVDVAQLSAAPSEFQAVPWSRPRIIGTRDPSPGTEQLALVESALAGRDKAMLPSYWRPYDHSRTQVLARARPLSDLRTRQPQAAQDIDRIAKTLGRPLAEIRYMPILARRSDWIVLIDGSNADVLGYEPIDGF